MAQTTPAQPAFKQEQTFSKYSEEQGKHYAQIRRNYHSSVYDCIINQHKATRGQFECLLDVGCGPGTAIRSLAGHFTHATGLDPSEGMISVARSLGGQTSTSKAIRYEVSNSQELGSNLLPPLADSSVDLIIAANAAHWFNMAEFWPAAARVLRPGGSVAIWTSGEIRAHPDMPNAAKIQAAMYEWEEENLKPYMEAGSLLVRNRYRDLPLPWTLAKPVTQFEESSFFRREWDLGEQFYEIEGEVDLDMFEKMMSTGSALTRWRQAHPEAAGTEEDVIRKLRRIFETLLHEAGVEPGKERVKGSVAGVVLIVKKKT